jgi:CRISPR-associated protein Cas2
MRQTYVVSYDVSDPKRLRKVFKTMRGYGEPLQLSVFRCDMSAQELVELRRDLGRVIDHRQDQVLFIHLGPEEGRGSRAIASMGRTYEAPQRVAVVV